ncbi:MAG: photosystem II protein Psb27 [Elainella sp.]
MRRLLSGFLALALVVVIGLTGCSASPTGLSGDYRQDTLAVIESVRSALDLPEDAPDKAEAQAEARAKINDFSARYRRDGSLLKLSSFTTMRTALNSLAGHYSSYPNRPVPQKMKDRIDLEFRQVESALKREA